MTSLYREEFSVDDWRQAILRNCVRLLDDAELLFDQGRYPSSCLMSIDAMEEAAKLQPIFVIYHNWKDLRVFPEGRLRPDEFVALLEGYRLPEKERKDLMYDHKDKIGSLLDHLGLDSGHIMGFYAILSLEMVEDFRSRFYQKKLRNVCQYVDQLEARLATPEGAVSRDIALGYLTFAIAAVHDKAQYAFLSGQTGKISPRAEALLNVTKRCDRG